MYNYLFDNNIKGDRKSRALAFSINEEEKSADIKLSTVFADSLYSFKQGSVYIIDDNRLLLCSSMKNKVVVTDFAGNILWQINSKDSFFRAEYLSKLPWE